MFMISMASTLLNVNEVMLSLIMNQIYIMDQHYKINNTFSYHSLLDYVIRAKKDDTGYYKKYLELLNIFYSDIYICVSI